MPSLPALSRRASRRHVVGLDIEPGAIRAAQVRCSDGRLVVERSAEAELEPGVLRDGEVVDAEALTGALRELFAGARLDRRVRVGVANARIVVRHLLLPPIADAAQLATAVRFMAADELPLPIDQAVLDHVVLGPVETPEGPRVRVLLVAARRSSVEGLLAAARAAGLRPEGVDLAAFAVGRALATAPGETVLHLNVGGVVNLALMHAGECVFTRVAPGGLEAMAIELAERAAVAVPDARRELAKGAGAGPDAQAVLSEGVRRIAADVRASLDFHLGAAVVGAPAPAGVDRVLLSGAAAAVPGLAEALGEQLGLAVQRAGVDGAGDEHGSSLVVAAGLAVEEAPA